MASKTMAMVGAGGAVFSLAAWLFYYSAFAGVRGEDGMVFYSAVRAALDGKLGLIYDGARLTADLNARFVGFLAHPLPLHPWLYPPHFLVLLLPFGFLPPVLAALAFLATSFALMAAALCALAHNPREKLLYVLSALLCPASAIVVWLGQNTFLTAGLLVGGFAFGQKRPVLGGVLLGALTYKPQFWLMVPVALIAARQWKMLAWALASATALMLTSLALLGPGLWRDWLQVMIAPSAMFDQWQALARLNGQSLYACARILGAGQSLANGVQYAGIALAGVAVWRARALPTDLKIAVLLAATIFAAPHIIDYDAVLLGLAATIFFAHILRHEPKPHYGDVAIAALLWLSPLVNPPSVFVMGMATPILTVLFVLRVLARADTEPQSAPLIAQPA